MSALSWIHTPRGELALQGAHVTRWRLGGEEMLFLSKKSRFESGQAIRGGIPVIFPWFGDDPVGRGRGAHGFARRVPWRVLRDVVDERSSRVVLELVDDEVTRRMWPRRFALRLEVEFGAELALALTVENRSDQPFGCETALHTYLRVGDVRQVTLTGLEGSTYLDKLDGMRRKRQPDAPLVFEGEVDRVYGGNTSSCSVVDPVLGRTLSIDKRESRSTIVWNPSVEKAARLTDLADDEWSQMLCVESGNVGEDALQLAPGASHTMRVRISCRH